MAFPAFGTRGWNDEVENEVSSAKADAASALANSSSALSAANSAQQTVTQFTADMTQAVSQAETAAISATASAGRARAGSADLASWPIWVFGNSYGALSGAWFTPGFHYAQLTGEASGGGEVSSFAVGGRRIVDVCSTLHNGAAVPGTNGVIGAGKMPTDDSRKGLMVLDSMVNEIGHYPAMNVAVPQPATITSANTRYLDGIAAMYRTAIALMSGGTRIEHSEAASSGTWTNQNLTTAYASGGALAYTTSVGGTRTYTVTPPQSGPLRGKVFHVGYRLDPSVGTSATYTVSVDGGTATTVPNTGWEQYTGHAATAVHTAWECAAIDVPVDGAPHTVAVAHAGTAGHFFYSDCVLVPSASPNPVAVMGAELPPSVGVWTQANIDAYVSNMERVEDAIKSVVDEFDNAFWVPSTMTSNGLYSGDSLHPNDRGMQQRANDLIAAIQPLIPQLQARVLAEQTTGFGVL